MRERLYLDTMAGIYAHSNKVLVDADNARPILNLGGTPATTALPALQDDNSAADNSTATVQPAAPTTVPARTPATNSRSNERSRSR